MQDLRPVSPQWVAEQIRDRTIPNKPNLKEERSEKEGEKRKTEAQRGTDPTRTGCVKTEISINQSIKVQLTCCSLTSCV
ncbi:hypothetical protein ACN42_g11872 [Penicillium freii]|uniref:Uncharacterized protein n=1 Tax=Penicillium freii TaxID=48697 RepID=A0A101M7E9_PENFR|nr:hypothetical protein ACN42_g11872 [Penicillium freii]